MKKLLIFAACGVLTAYASFEPPVDPLHPLLHPPLPSADSATIGRFWDAVRNNKLGTVKELIDQMPYEEVDPDTGETPLHAAIKAKPFLGFLGSTFELVEIVHDHNRSATMAQDNEGNSPVHLAVMGGNPDIVRLLIATDSGEEACFMKNKNWLTPLEIAQEMRDQSTFFTSRIQKIVDLIKAAQAKERDEHKKFQEDPVRAVFIGTIEITDGMMSKLQEYVKDNEFKFTRCNGRESILHMVLDEYFKYTKRRGSSLEAPYDDYKNLFEYAKKLMSAYPSMLVLQNQHGDTALHRAIEHYSPEVVEEILKYTEGLISMLLKDALGSTPAAGVQYIPPTKLKEKDAIIAMLKQARKQLKQEQHAQ